MLAAAALIALIAVESRINEPLIELHLFRRGPFLAAVGVAVLAFAAFAAFLFVVTLFLQDGRGYSPVQAGLLPLPLAVAVVVSAPLSGRLVAATGRVRRCASPARARLWVPRCC